MFTILLVLLVCVAWVASHVARAVQSVAAKSVDLSQKPVFDNARDRVCRANGQYHEVSKAVKYEGAKLYVRGRRAYQSWREAS